MRKYAVTFSSVALLALLQGCGAAETPPAKAPEEAHGKSPPKTKSKDSDAQAAAKASEEKSAAPIAPPPAAPVVEAAPVALSDSPSDLDEGAKAPYKKAIKALAAGDLAGARVALFDATNKAPNSATAHHALGAVLERAGDSAGAQAQYRKALTSAPSYEPAIQALAMSLARSRNLVEADALVTEKHAKFPNSVAISTTLAELKSLEDDHAATQRLVQDALKLRPDYVPAMITIARDYFRARKYDVARYALRVILDGSEDGSIPPRDKDNAEAHLLRGLIERQMGERKAAMEDFAAAAAASGSSDPFEALINVGEMKLEAGNAQEALASLEKAVHLSPASAVAHLDMGDCYRVLGRVAESKRELDTALSLDSSLASVHYDLGLLYMFSPKVPGVATQDEQIGLAIKQFELFKSMQPPKGHAGTGDDVDELLTTAKRKQGELQVKKNAAAQAPAAGQAPAGATTPAPAPSAATPAKAEPKPAKSDGKPGK